MREILFRAKRKNWSELPKEEWWVEGSYHHQTDYYGESCDKHYIIDGTETDMEGYGEHYEIDPETLCQYTGLTDKNGKLIWENDIVRKKIFDHEVIGIVKWLDIGFTGFRLEVAKEDGKKNLYSIGRGTYDDDMCERCDDEIIGNIFDNPELLKGDQSCTDL